MACLWLPEDLWVEIFSFLPLSDWFRTFLVCKSWNHYAKRAFKPSTKPGLLMKLVFSGKSKSLAYLISHYHLDPSWGSNFALRTACRLGNTEMVRVLLEAQVDPSFDENYPIRIAASKGHLEVVKILLGNDRVDPTDYRCFALHMAKCHKHSLVVKELLQDPRVQIHPDAST